MSDVIEAGFGETYSVAIKGIEDFSKSFNVRVNYQGLSEMVRFVVIASIAGLCRLFWMCLIV